MGATQRGFTLIELMIVIAIIGILAAIAIPAYQDYTIRSQVSEGAILADGAKVAITEFYNNNGQWPSSNASAGLETSTSISGKYVGSLDAGTTAPGEIIAKFATGAPRQSNKRIEGSLLVFSASVSSSAGSINWNCKASAAGTAKTNLPNKYLPSVCRS
jgi:type IV pilus assembly protein PilA